MVCLNDVMNDVADDVKNDDADVELDAFEAMDAMIKTEHPMDDDDYEDVFDADDLLEAAEVKTEIKGRGV